MAATDRLHDVLTHVVHASPYAIIVIQHTGQIVEWNPQAQTIFGWQREEVLGEPVHEVVIPERLRENHVAGIEQFLKTGESQILGKRLEVPGVRKSGKEFPAELSVTMESGGKYFAAYVRDLTNTKQTEQLLAEQQRKLAHVTRLNTLSELASGIAHEMNQPLTAIANVAAVGLASNDIDVTHDEVRKIEKYVAHAGQLVGRFRKLTTKSIVARKPHDINQQINEVIGLLDNEIHHAAINLHTHLESNLPKVFIDDIQIQQVIINIIHNATEALAELPAKNIDVYSYKEKDTVKITVKNNGPKLTDNRVFEAFHTTKKNGIGLGLSISRTIIENHDGRIWLNNDCADTEFCFSLPVGGNAL